jgi:AraC-like DNA-binding protein
MPKIFVYQEDHGKCIENLKESLYALTNWDITIKYKSDFNSIAFDHLLDNEGPNFLIYNLELDNTTIDHLYKIRNKHPFICIIYLSESLIDQQFRKLSEIGINSCIIGLECSQYLSLTLDELWAKHWKRVPEHFYYNVLHGWHSYRVRNIITYIENNPLKYFNTDNLADHLKISSSYFRVEFKNIFGISFREFKQNIVRHYESLLLLKMNHKLCEVYKELNYSSVSNMSKSFKKRHGTPLRKSMNSGSDGSRDY